ncbi:Hpt domain-containing protein [Rubritalea profundi]|uniref:HPt domain-containing protein n=1 Tax=Rubritalea profundi TaxID=1658618 RepID=A0A2S7U315_9BACT|nr:Hpt domain-containing protein [Rubritalea profundi]PQJ29386.1 hypothetical protein BSZ32_13420 [Rubritalea profundi]
MNVEIDKFHLLTLVGDDAEAVGVVLEEFGESGLALVDLMAAARSQGDTEEFRAVTHQLKGAGGMFGMLTLHVVCEQLESTKLVDVTEGKEAELRRVFMKSHQLVTDLVLG